jgi:hypothetical protein
MLALAGDDDGDEALREAMARNRTTKPLAHHRLSILS